MIVHTHKRFDKSFLKLHKDMKKKVIERIMLFRDEPNNHLLNTHKLHADYIGYSSFNVTGDVRVVFRYINTNTVELVYVGTHSELYS